ncbi:flavodoxin-dependent (E)-4-hydroxy-3-methylbut-2-enyl-diphosphate synthase [Kitasatospora sp. NPDC088391]|uniref:flavodoxin-dependent (E)-4-hydroxy-3-methylbut-2-enyl-diphosphate synthase n=1 Tax=Kitasatospora sp. NPDC088391 TaxID=3364074 RepID=UPI003825E8BD
MTAVNPGLPATPSRVPPRRPGRRIMVGRIPVGGGAPVTGQTTTTTPTVDIDATLQQIAEVTAAGCDIVRVAVPSQDDADAPPEITRRSKTPVVAASRFPPRYVPQAIDAGCAAVRVNPGTVKRKAGPHILAALGLRPRRPETVSCPGRARLQVDVHSLATRVEAAFDGFPHPLRTAVMGCVGNGPGEARDADLGVSCGNGKGQVFRRGEVVSTVPEARIVEAPRPAASASASAEETGTGAGE